MICDSTAITASEKDGVEIDLVLTKSQADRKFIETKIVEEKEVTQFGITFEK